MTSLPPSIIIVLALLTVFLSLSVGLRYAIRSQFVRTRLIMTLFFFFIIGILTISFWRSALLTLPYTVPAVLFGALVGYLLGVRTERKKLTAQGLAHYMEHFAHIHFHDIRSLTWWSFINFYSVMGALVLINLVGLSNVIFLGAEAGVIATSMFGAFLIGTIIPYLAHLWSIRARHQPSNTTSER
ncbi:MAG: hypothetical protein Q7R54_02345 [bacterium]|nr:hypothetical protein [bacterium]